MIGGLAFVGLAAPAVGLAKATHPPEDPWESFNRKSFAFSMRVDRTLIAPLSRFSAGLTPGPIGKAIHNIVVNLSEPVVMANDVVQARLRPAVKSAMRLVVNSTIGLLGAVDVAAKLGVPHHPNGFGDTLGRYGVKPGPYVYVPVLGPSTVRDLFGSGVDDFSNPIIAIRYPYRNEAYLTLQVVAALDERARAGPELRALLEGATDPYATLRSTYLQMREAEIRGQASLPSLPDIPSAPAAMDPPVSAGGAAAPGDATAQAPVSEAPQQLQPQATDGPSPPAGDAPPSPPPGPATPPAAGPPPAGPAPA